MPKEPYSPIDHDFVYRGFRYHQITREGNLAIYEQTWTGSKTPSIAYEVVRIRVAPPHTFPTGVSYPAREVYPSDESWGADGFTCTDKDRAFAKLKELQGKQE